MRTMLAALRGVEGHGRVTAVPASSFVLFTPAFLTAQRIQAWARVSGGRPVQWAGPTTSCCSGRGRRKGGRRHARLAVATAREHSPLRLTGCNGGGWGVLEGVADYSNAAGLVAASEQARVSRFRCTEPCTINCYFTFLWIGFGRLPEAATAAAARSSRALLRSPTAYPYNVVDAPDFAGGCALRRDRGVVVRPGQRKPWVRGRLAQRRRLAAARGGLAARGRAGCDVGV